MNAKRPLVAFIAIVSLIFLYIPSIAVAVFSVNNAKFGLAWRGFTWKWYEQLLQNEIILVSVFKFDNYLRACHRISGGNRITSRHIQTFQISC